MSLNIAILREHLAMANRHIASGNRVVIRQRELIAELKSDGHDTKDAVALLVQFEELLALHLSDRDRLFDELRSAAAETGR